MRVGIGYDIHQMEKRRKLTLGGVVLPYHSGLVGHSDADVMLHAICDALLGAAALGDIGQHFPNTDPKYYGISSLFLLNNVFKMLKEKRYRVVNVDVTIVAEEPKLAKHIPVMKQNISQVLEISEANINIKATTNEQLGSLGRKRGIAAHAVALIDENSTKKSK